MKWDRLRLFNIVAQTRNITEASYILQMSQSALSRQMKALENELGVRLFLRNSDGISLTKAGMRLFSSVQILASDISKTHNQLLEDMDVPSGRLNVSATNAFGALWVAPRMSKFKNLFPSFSLIQKKNMMPFSYLLSGGHSFNTRISRLIRITRSFEKFFFDKYLGMFNLICLEKI